MQSVTTTIGYLPVRREPSDRSEMVSQFLFGETAEVLETDDKWAHIRNLFDGYTGWTELNSLRPAEGTGEEHTQIVRAPSTTVISKRTGRQLYLPAGAVVPQPANNSFQIAGEEFVLLQADDLWQPGEILPLEDTGNRLCSIPYLWGGRCGFGFDCSGLTQLICRLRGIPIPRDSGVQSLLGTTINFAHEALPGDLLFFDNEEGVIVHTGVVLFPGIILHASGSVRTDRFDHQGIFHSERKEYSHKLRVIRRLG